jgi:hypothetical protein
MPEAGRQRAADFNLNELDFPALSTGKVDGGRLVSISLFAKCKN